LIVKHPMLLMLIKYPFLESTST